MQDEGVENELIIDFIEIKIKTFILIFEEKKGGKF